MESSMTGRELVQPFLRRLNKRYQELDHKMETENTTPEEHGEQYACSSTRFELSIRLRKQEKGEISEGWEKDFLACLRKGPVEEAETRAALAWMQYEKQFAAELEAIWHAAGIL